jgi:hypothetical protein
MGQKEDATMRKTILALTAATGLLGFGAASASALTLGPANGSDQARTAEGSAVQKADWYCGPRCHYWHQRRWQEGREWREHRQPYYRYGYNGYNGYNNGYYYR